MSQAPSGFFMPTATTTPATAMRRPPAGVVVTDMPSVLGPLRLAATAQALCGVWFADQRGIPSWAQTPLSPPTPALALLQQTMQALNDYLAGHRQGFDLPLDLSSGTCFQQSVWSALATIPYGGHCSYADLALRVGRPQAVRAVGQAVGRNPLGIVLPCHRVLGKGGTLTGYTGGLDRKRWLLHLESSSLLLS